ncbi:ATP-binding protein [Streptomyces sp. LP05-1]|uniref:ATP-binding protein n=1 Tax=Streptomyces pyxinae TaxID=2970734 RepID=A0ABT2CBC5_9ACTN|nr:ATP-binding protein [Streptomyces sp. LP05-1]MCS0634715.1 ATP-binding protein [Streptomyces sp. LP05-1]
MDETRIALPSSAAGARNAVALVLAGHLGLRGAELREHPLVGDALLATSELATNAIRHGGGISGFRTDITAEGLVLRISDSSPREPDSSGAGDPTAPGGFGWPMIQRLASHIAVTRDEGGGKSITLVLPLPRP